MTKHPGSNRAFLGRAVHFLAAKAGIRQFLDIVTGTWITTQLCFRMPARC
jgi:S-adenosyl methyltransferase